MTAIGTVSQCMNLRGQTYRYLSWDGEDHEDGASKYGLFSTIERLCPGNMMKCTFYVMNIMKDLGTIEAIVVFDEYFPIKLDHISALILCSCEVHLHLGNFSVRFCQVMPASRSSSWDLVTNMKSAAVSLTRYDRFEISALQTSNILPLNQYKYSIFVIRKK